MLSNVIIFTVDISDNFMEDTIIRILPNLEIMTKEQGNQIEHNSNKLFV